MCRLTPLHQWICDKCHEVVDVDDGWLEWLHPVGGQPHDFKIVHNKAGCFHYDREYDRADMHINAFMGPEGLQYFLSFLDYGNHFSSQGPSKLPEMSSFVDTVRRIHIPYYEEARIYFGKAHEDGFFEEANEVFLYLPSTCKTIVERYSED